ncbi:hypothetical protein VTN96DRAFT_6222 [Rasamsonia emersonii]
MSPFHIEKEKRMVAGFVSEVPDKPEGAPKVPDMVSDQWPVLVDFDKICTAKFSAVQQLQTVDLHGGSAIAIVSPFAAILCSIHPEIDDKDFRQALINVISTKNKFRDYFDAPCRIDLVLGSTIDNKYSCPTHEAIFRKEIKFPTGPKFEVPLEYDLDDKSVPYHGIVGYSACYGHLPKLITFDSEDPPEPE